MPRCSASGCRNMGSHTFPKDPSIRTLWEKAMNKENFKASKHSRLCYDHFKPSDYADVCLSTGMTPFHRYLKKSAVPSIFSSNVDQSGTNGSRVIKAKTSSRQQLSRHLKKGVVPSVFPWTKKPKSTSDSTQQQKVSCDPNLRKFLKKTAVPSIFSNTRKFAMTISSSPQKISSPPKNKDIKKEAISPPNTPIKEEESNSSDINNALRNRSMRLKNRKAYLLNRKCSVPLCNSRPSNEISLHPCPNNAAVRNEWAEALRVSYQYVKNMVACSLHFTKLNFIQSSNSERILKHNAVPSRNLPIRKKVVPGKNKILRKDNAFERQQRMTGTVGETKEDLIPEELTRECRTCLNKLDGKKSCCNVFQAWAPPWVGMEATIAEDLAKLANVEISQLDRHSKVLCSKCYQMLLDAAKFAARVRNSDLLLRMRFTAEIDMEKVWPKPIQVDKNINGSVFNSTTDIEIKQEVVSDEEYPVNSTNNQYLDTELSSLDIKIEPEELMEPAPMNITINGTISLDPLNSENKDVKNGADVMETHSMLTELEIKQEPTSEGEQEIEQPPDLSLECLLCTKSFNSVSGLKAHVIAEHSYKTVKRKADGSVSPEKKRCDLHQCAICKRSFQTPTDLMVHETCHNKHACYGCTEKFDSFELLTRHRKRCKACIGNSVQKLKTLEDVKRPLPEEKVKYLEIERVEPDTTSKEKQYNAMAELEIMKNEDGDVEMKDLNSTLKEENQDCQENKGGSVNDKAENDKTIESENKEVENEITLKSSKEPDNDERPEGTTEDNDKKQESVLEGVDDDKKPESVIEEVNTDEQSRSVIQEQEEVNYMQLESLVENVDDSEKLICQIEEVDSIIEKVDTQKEEDSEENLESIIKEVNRDDKAESEKDELVTEVPKTESEIKEDLDSNMKLHLEIHSTKNETEPTLCDADMVVETLDNDDCI